MDAGVPITSPVSGIAMGLVQDLETGEYQVLSDIQGMEDALGDMDFKVAGTEHGITALQMDLKIKGLDFDILRQAMDQATRRAHAHHGQDARGAARAAQRPEPLCAAHPDASTLTRRRSAS